MVNTHKHHDAYFMFPNSLRAKGRFLETLKGRRIKSSQRRNSYRGTRTRQVWSKITEAKSKTEFQWNRHCSKH